MITLTPGIPAHATAGRTDLTERLLHAAETIDEIGGVHDSGDDSPSAARAGDEAVPSRSRFRREPAARGRV